MGATPAILAYVAAGAAIGGTAVTLTAPKPSANAGPVQAALNTPPPVMPTQSDPAIAQARQRSLSAQIARRGRDSTILTGQSDKLG